MLKPRSALWTYQRGSRKIRDNLTKCSTNPESEEPAQVNQVNQLALNHEEEDLSEDYEIPEDMELIIDRLLQAIGDKDTVVRFVCFYLLLLMYYPVTLHNIFGTSF